MNKLLIISALVTITLSTTFAQVGNVGIGTSSPDASAKLDIDVSTGTKSGLLIPRLNLTGTGDVTTIASPATGLLVFNVTAAGSGSTAVTANSFYYYDGSKWVKLQASNVKDWSLEGNAAITAPATSGIYGTTAFGATENFVGTTDAQPLTFGTNNIERMRILTGSAGTGGNIGIGTKTPTATALLTINATTNGVRNGIDMSMSGATSTATALKIAAVNSFTRGVDYSNSTTGVPSVALYGVGTELTGAVPASGNSGIVSGYLSYRNTTASPNNKSYGLYGINGLNGSYSTNANSWAAFLQGRTVISSAASPTSVVGTDLEVQNTTAAISTIATPNPANISLRQTNNILIANTPMTALNFGDSYVTTPQAQIGVLRDVTSSSAGDLPTALTFSTIPDASATLTERVRIANTGNVGIGNNNPGIKMHINGGLATTPSTAAAAAAITIPANVSTFYITLVAGVTANAVSASGPVEGQYLTIVNLDGDPATFAGATIPATTGVGEFQYINAAWRIMGISSGTNNDWTKSNTISTPAVKSDNQYVTGNVGIGDFSASSPSYKLHVENGADRSYFHAGTAGSTESYVSLARSNFEGVNAFAFNDDAVQGSTPSSSYYGVYGINSGATGVGIYGSGVTYGVEGYTPSTANGTYGVRGTWSSTRYGYLGGKTNSASPYYVGAYGTVPDADGFGILGWNTSTSGTGIMGAGNNVGTSYYLTGGSGGAFTGIDWAIYAKNTSLGTSGAIYTDNGGAITRLNYYNGTTFTQYKILGSGTVSTIVKDVNDKDVTLHCTETPEIYFQDYGEGKLVNGKTHIDIDPNFSKNVTVNDKHPLRVFVQLEGDCNGVYISNKSINGFDVVELANGKSNASFQWTVVCNRADEVLASGKISKNADQRFEPAPEILKANSVDNSPDNNQKDIKWKSNRFEAFQKKDKIEN